MSGVLHVLSVFMWVSSASLVLVLDWELKNLRVVRVYSGLAPSVPGIGSGSTTTLTRFKRLLKRNERYSQCFSHSERPKTEGF